MPRKFVPHFMLLVSRLKFFSAKRTRSWIICISLSLFWNTLPETSRKIHLAPLNHSLLLSLCSISCYSSPSFSSPWENFVFQTRVINLCLLYAFLSVLSCFTNNSMTLTYAYISFRGKAITDLFCWTWSFRVIAISCSSINEKNDALFKPQRALSEGIWKLEYDDNRVLSALRLSNKKQRKSEIESYPVFNLLFWEKAARIIALKEGQVGL